MPRVIETGDLVHVEFAGVARRYHVVALHTMAVGEPDDRVREIYDLTLESLRAGIKECQPGNPVANIEKASLKPLEREGLAHTAMMRFGLGIGIGYPPVWVGSFQTLPIMSIPPASKCLPAAATLNLTSSEKIAVNNHIFKLLL